MGHGAAPVRGRLGLLQLVSLMYLGGQFAGKIRLAMVIYGDYTILKQETQFNLHFFL